MKKTRAQNKASWYKQDKKKDPRKYRLKNIFNTIERREKRKLSEHERQEITSGFDAELNEMCCYCGEALTIKNISCDHDVPISRGGVKETCNLQFICLSCNFMKGNLTGDEFDELMGFLRMHPNIMAIVSQRLKMSGIIFTKRK